MMKRDGRDSAECQNWEKRDIMVILEIVLNENNAKTCTGHVFSNYKGRQNVNWRKSGSEVDNGGFSERESSFSLEIWRSDRRQSSGQEGKLLYVERASRGYQI